VHEAEPAEKAEQDRALGVLGPILQRHADRYSFEIYKNQLYVYKCGADNLSNEQKLPEWLSLASELTSQLG